MLELDSEVYGFVVNDVKLNASHTVVRIGGVIYIHLHHFIE